MDQTPSPAVESKPRFDVKLFFISLGLGIGLFFAANYIENLILLGLNAYFGIDPLALPSVIVVAFLVAIWLLFLWPFSAWRKYKGLRPFNPYALALSILLSLLLMTILMVMSLRG